MDLRGKFSNAITVLVVMCAILTTSLVVRREIIGEPKTSATAMTRASVYIDEWEDAAAAGVRVGPSGAPIQLVNFVDYECVFCAHYAQTLDAFRALYPDKVSIVVHHYPIPTHPAAYAAAKAAECALVQGGFERMSAALYARQADLGKTPWNELAALARVPDLVAFDACMGDAKSERRIAAGQAFVERFGIEGTPTIIVNGWKLDRAPTLEQLKVMLANVADGKDPLGNRTWKGLFSRVSFH